jgi:hypothetical protein
MRREYFDGSLNPPYMQTLFVGEKRLWPEILWQEK